MPRRAIPLTPPHAQWTAEGAGGAPPRMTVAAAGTAIELAAPPRVGGEAAAALLDAAVDLRPFTDLRLTLQGTPPTGEPAFYLELALGSATLGPTAAGNDWRRLLPVSATPAAVSLSIEDLPDAARRAVDRMRLTALAGAPRFTCRLGPLIAIRDSMLADVDEALLELLDGHGQVAGRPLRATFGEREGAHPMLRLQNVAVRAAPERAREAPVRSDYTATGFALRPPRVPYDLTYHVWLDGGDRAATTEAIDFVLGRLGPHPTLPVDGASIPLDLLDPPATPSEVLTLAFVVRTSQRRAARPDRGVPPYQRVDIDVAHPSEAPGKVA